MRARAPLQKDGWQAIDLIEKQHALVADHDKRGNSRARNFTRSLQLKQLRAPHSVRSAIGVLTFSRRCWRA